MFNDLANATDVDSRAFIGDIKPLAQTLTAKNQADWSEVNPLPAPVTTNRILEEPDVIHNFGAVMNDMEDEGKAPVREIPIANDYYSPIFGNHVPNFLLQLPTVEAVDATRRRLLDNVWQRYGASGQLELDPQGESLLGKANALGDLLSEGPDLTGQAYRRAFGGSGDEHALRTAFQSAQGKLIDPTLDPDEYQAWFGGLRPFEQQAARAAAAGDVLRAVQAGRTDIFQSPLVQRRMQAAFGSGSAADLLENLRLENLASSLRLPGAQGGAWGDAQVPPELDATPPYGASTSTVVAQPTPRAAFFPPPLAAWSAQQGQNQQ
ncbi:MAG TPA: hypothetical protein VH353_11640 [Caulobacteraceae bacterium]|nr:hypothetical protein [Caulobacteraceae bacterium]